MTLSAQIVGVAKVKQFMLDSKTEIDAQYLQKYIKTKTKKIKLYRFVHVQTGSHWSYRDLRTLFKDKDRHISPSFSERKELHDCKHCWAPKSPSDYRKNYWYKVLSFL